MHAPTKLLAGLSMPYTHITASVQTGQVTYLNVLDEAAQAQQRGEGDAVRRQRARHELPGAVQRLHALNWRQGKGYPPSLAS